MGSLTEDDKTQLKVRVHEAAREGMAISVFALLCNMDKPVIKEILDHATEQDGQKTTPLIIAAMRGETKVVQVLLGNFNVDIEQKSMVQFDGYVIQDATALWCASGAGHLDIVRMLVQYGADVNNATASNSTPLRAACFDGRLDIVKYLIENKADLTIPNKYDNTCLMISCYKGHTQVVRHLLEKGADPNVKAHCGATSIHFAAECGHLNVVKELVHFGALMLENDLRMTPIMVAAECGKEDVFHYFLKQPQTSRLCKIEALELLGAHFANDKETYDLQKTYNYLREAMLLRMVEHRTGASCARLDKIPKPDMLPVPAYAHHRESQNMAELARMRLNRDALHMEALTIRERILGPNNPEIPHPVIFRGAVFADNGQFGRCIALWMHAMRLRQTNSRSIAKDLLRFAQVFSQMVTIGAELCYDDVDAVLVHGLEELYGFQKASHCSESDLKATAMELHQNNLLSIIYLITVASRVVRSNVETRRLHKHVYQFLKSRPTLKNGYSPLHIVLDSGICVDDFHVNSLVIFPSKALSSMFISCGADIDALDHSCNTPLHIISNLRPTTPAMEQLQKEIIEDLLYEGAHCDIVNNKRQTPFNLATGCALTSLCCLGNISLRCIAARCIKSNKIAFKSNIPQCLESFVDLH